MCWHLTPSLENQRGDPRSSPKFLMEAGSWLPARLAEVMGSSSNEVNHRLPPVSPLPQQAPHLVPICNVKCTN